MEYFNSDDDFYDYNYNTNFMAMDVETANTESDDIFKILEDIDKENNEKIFQVKITISESLLGYLRVTDTMENFLNHLQKQFMGYYLGCIEFLENRLITSIKSCKYCEDMTQNNNIEMLTVISKFIRTQKEHTQFICDIWNTLIKQELYNMQDMSPRIFLFAMMLFIRLHHKHKYCITSVVLLKNNYFFIACLILAIKKYNERSIENMFIIKFYKLFCIELDINQLNIIEKCVTEMLDKDFSINEEFIKFEIAKIATPQNYL
jgi:hypothetical protein